jgi:hypothetical protein
MLSFIYRPSTNISNIIYTYIPIHTERVPKSGTVEETKGGGKKGKIVNDNEMHHICVGTRHKETH